MQDNLTAYSMHKKNEKKANKPAQPAEIDASCHASDTQSR